MNYQNCKTKSIVSVIWLGLAWLGLAWLGLAWLGLQEVYHSFTPTIYLKYPTINTRFTAEITGALGFLCSLCFLGYRVCCVNPTSPTNTTNSINLNPNISVFSCFLCVFRVLGGKIFHSFLPKPNIHVKSFFNKCKQGIEIALMVLLLYCTQSYRAQ